MAGTGPRSDRGADDKLVRVTGLLPNADPHNVHILITGNMGYVGPVLTRHLRATLPDARLTGYDSGYFAHCLTGATRLPETRVDAQIIGDLRDFPHEALDGVDAVVHLAAISNDPMGNRFEAVTEDINARAGIALATAAKARGVSHFVFASSCSMYGFAEGGPRREDDALNPLTAYARSKVATERGLEPLSGKGFTVSCLRFATACGMSDRLRLDLVLNDFVAGALSSGRIDILSDGSPWRPLIAVDDMALAMEWAIRRDPDVGGDFLAVNTGSNEWNYQVRELAEAVARVIPGTEVHVNPEAAPDKRSYRVNFDRFAELAPDHVPRVSLAQAVRGLRDGLTAARFTDAGYRDSDLMRLKALDAHRESGALDETLRWSRGA